MNFRAAPGGHTLYYGIVTGTRAIAAERDGFTERPWRGGAGARGAPAASDVSIIPGASGMEATIRAASEREGRCRAIDRLADHAHPG